MPDSVYLVSTPAGVDQIFAGHDHARRYARDVPDASVTEHVLRTSVDDAVVIIDRRVVVADGKVRQDRTSWVTQFIDASLFMPEPADVECYRADDGHNWHIYGFGTDPDEVDVLIRETVDQLHRADQADAGSSR